ncbi:MAG TPA: hypothetical protein VML96_04700, partial [Egibacteraceae bacterium]|nr:hypothetical protein [Egibacteraceae bacterium]
MPDRSLEEINAEMQEVDRQLLELTGSAGSGQVAEFGSDLEQVQGFLNATMEDLGEVKGDIEGYVDDLKNMTVQMEELLDQPDVKEFIDGVTGGLESTANIVEKVKEGLGEVGEAAATLELGERLTSDDAREQIEALADAFEAVTDKLGPLIDAVPGLGAFFKIYGMAIRNIAESAGVLTEITARNNQLYETIRPGQHLYITADTLKSDQIRDLETKRARLMDEAIQAATDERIAREQGELGSGVTEVDIVVRTAQRKAADAQPALNSAARSAWVDSSRRLEAATAARESARANLMFARDDAARASTALETARGSASDSAALEARAQMTASALERAQARMDEANSEFDEAVESHNQASAAHHAEIDAYNSAVTAEIISLIPYANKGKGFTNIDYALLSSQYPQWSVRPGEAAAPADGRAAERPRSVGAVGGAAAAGASAKPSGSKAPLLIGGLLGGALLIAAVVIVPRMTAPETVQPEDAETAAAVGDVETAAAVEDVETAPTAEDVAAAPERIDVQTTDGTATYIGPTSFAAETPLEVSIEVRDSSGQPVVGAQWFITIGDPPSSPDAVHAETTTDEQGRATFRLGA